MAGQGELTAAEGPEVWTSADVGDPRQLAEPFTPEEIAEMAAVVAAARERGIAAEAATADLFAWPCLAERARRGLATLRDGPGLVYWTGLPVDRFDKEALRLVYWGLGLAIGKPVSQSAKGDMLGDVRDMSHIDPNVRAYQNRNELTPHTDHTEVVGLMCLRDSREGGETPLASAPAIHNEILRTRPDLLAILYRGFRYHRRGEEQPGDDPITPHRVPVFSRVGRQVSCRLVRPYIAAAAAELGTPLSDAETEALDLVQDLARDPRFRLPLRLEPGSMVLFNNYTTLHERTPFVDWDEPDRKRHLVRMWLVPEHLRDVLPGIEVFTTKGGIARRDAPARTYDWGVGGR